MMFNKLRVSSKSGSAALLVGAYFCPLSKLLVLPSHVRLKS